MYLLISASKIKLLLIEISKIRF